MINDAREYEYDDSQNMGYDYVSIDVRTVIDKEEGKAVLFDDGDRTFWVPKSLMYEWPGVDKTGTAMIADWFVEKEGLV